MMPVSCYLCIFLNVGLGEAAKRDVGTGENQIPDMSAWKRNPSSNRWRKLPDGTII
ncbi:phage tail protein, partial [Escherichia coli]